MKNTIILAALGLLATLPTQAALVNRYSLNGDGTDSVGGQTGTLTAPATISATSLVTSGNGGAFALPATVGSGIGTGDFSIEQYVTKTGDTAFHSTIFNISNGQANFILFKPDNNGTNIRLRQANLNGGNEFGVSSTTPLFSGNDLQHQVLLSYTSLTGAFNVYVNGTSFISGTVLGLNFSALTGANNGIQSNNPYNDPSFTGTTNDFRIYDQAITATQAGLLSAAGANATNVQITAIIPEPSSLGLIALSAFGLMALRRRRSN